MGVLDRWRRRNADTPDLEKAARGPAVATTFTADDVIGLVRAGAEAAKGTPATPLPRDPADVNPFGPGHPLSPAAIDAARRDSSRPEPRLTEYAVSANLPGVTDRLIPWRTLRDAANVVGLFRRCIEVRKAEIIGIEWDVAISKDAISQALRAEPGASKVDVERALREQFEPEIGRLRQFWQTPDRGNGHTFVDWVQMLLEEYFVLDAIAIYPRRTYGETVWSLEVLDGSTIKPLLDHRGGRPLPPHPAYQQILQGFPRGEFVASITGTDGEVRIPNAYPADQLLYLRRNVRSFTPYGCSPVEQALLDGEVWMRRLEWMKSEYTEGTMPPARLKYVGGDPDFWTPGQLSIYEQALNDMMTGNTAERRRLKMLPPGWETDGDQSDAAERYRPDYDLFLIKLVAGHFETVATELGFTETSGLGSAGFHEGQADVQDRKGTHPTLVWLQSRLTDIQRSTLGAPAELEFRFLGLDSEDETAEDAVWEARVKTGRATINEDRDRIGLPRFDFDDADKPMVYTNRGVFPLEGAADRAVANEQAEQDIAKATAAGKAAAPAGPAGAPAKKPAAVTKTDELRSLRTFLAKGDRGRPFTAEHLTVHDVADAGLDPTRVLFKTDGADAGGRPERRRTGGVDRVRPLPQPASDGDVVVYRPGVREHH